MNAAWARVDVYSTFIIKNTAQRRTVLEITSPPSINSLKPYFLCILPDYRFFFGFTTIYRLVQYLFWQNDITGAEGRERVSYQSRIPVPAVGLEVSIPVLTYIQRDLVSTARAVRAILFIQSVETLRAVIQGGGTAIVRHWHRLHVLIDDEENTKKRLFNGCFHVQ